MSTSGAGTRAADRKTVTLLSIYYKSGDGHHYYQNGHTAVDAFLRHAASLRDVADIFDQVATILSQDPSATVFAAGHVIEVTCRADVAQKLVDMGGYWIDDDGYL